MPLDYTVRVGENYHKQTRSIYTFYVCLPILVYPRDETAGCQAAAPEQTRLNIKALHPGGVQIGHLRDHSHLAAIK